MKIGKTVWYALLVMTFALAIIGIAVWGTDKAFALKLAATLMIYCGDVVVVSVLFKFKDDIWRL